MNTKKIAGIFGAIMLSMTVAGVSYAHWAEYLTIEGEFCMGTMDIYESVCVWFDIVNDKTQEPYGDHVAKAWIQPTESIEDGIVRDIKVTIYNAYPNLNGYIVLDYHNIGTVPAALYELLLDDECCWEIMDWPDQGQGDYLHVWVEGWYPPDNPQASPEQLDPCNVGYLVLGFRLTNDVEEGAYYSFSAQTTWYNWKDPGLVPVQLPPADLPPGPGYYIYDCMTPDFRYGYVPDWWQPYYTPPGGWQ